MREQLLATAGQVARLLARLAATVRRNPGGAGGTDPRGVARIENALSHLRPLRSAVTGIESEMEVVRKHATELDAEIRRVLIALIIALTQHELRHPVRRRGGKPFHLDL